MTFKRKNKAKLTPLASDTDTDKDGIQAAADALGNPLGTNQPYEDILIGSAGNDHVWAGEGDDTVLGEDGNDTISGQAGNDALYGGAGDDTLHGDQSGQIVAGNNTLNGEDGNAANDSDWRAAA